MKLERNNGKMGMRPRGEKWEWYTAKEGPFCSLHVYNKTESGLWTYGLLTVSQHVIYGKEFITKEKAFEAAKQDTKNLLNQALRGIE